MNPLKQQALDSAASIDVDETKGVEQHTSKIEALKSQRAALQASLEALRPVLQSIVPPKPDSHFEKSQYKALHELPQTSAALQRGLAQGLTYLDHRIGAAQDALHKFLSGIKERREALAELNVQLTARDEADLERFTMLLEKSGLVVKQKGARA